MIKYSLSGDWIRYDSRAVTSELAETKAVVLALRPLPYQRSWVEALQKIELKREVAGTSRIEGADFTDLELEDAIRKPPEELLTRSHRQAHAAVEAYRRIATVPDDRPLDEDLFRQIHRLIVIAAADDHCPPGQLRRRDPNVRSGTRGIEAWRGEMSAGRFSPGSPAR